jgi:hypothetical protein
MYDTSTSSAVSHDGYPVGVASEKVNVPPDPVQSKTLVVEAGVCDTILLESWAPEESKRTNAIVNCNKDKAVVAVFCCPSQ